MRGVQRQLAGKDDERLAAIEGPLRDGIVALAQVVRFIVSSYASDAKQASVGAVPFLELLGIVAGGWQMARAALISHQRLGERTGDTTFHHAKLETARFYSDHVLARAPGLAYTAVHGAAGALAIADDQF
jgi:acyl-CoA dehydrogenase